MSKRKQYNPEFKAKVALEALKDLHARIGRWVDFSTTAGPMPPMAGGRWFWYIGMACRRRPGPARGRHGGVKRTNGETGQKAQTVA